MIFSTLMIFGMSKVYLFSDPHFGHENMAKRRGFASVDEHDTHIICNWNDVVTKHDMVMLLGDITMGKGDYRILDTLNGKINVILGNHDKHKHVRAMLNHVKGVSGGRKYKNAWITHIPMHPNELYGLPNIHGHVHSKDIPDNRYFNVSCEAINYRPILFEAVMESIAAKAL